MTESTSHLPHHGLIYGGHLPLAWKPLSALPADTELAALDYANSEVLRTIFALESHVGEISEDTEGKSPDLVRLDFKVNLLLDLVGQLLSKQLVIPHSRELTLTADGMLWQESNAPPPDSLLRIELYLNLRYPRPLALHARVREIQDRRVAVAFCGQSEAVREGLERFIFVHHRRAVAQSRLKNRRSFPES